MAGQTSFLARSVALIGATAVLWRRRTQGPTPPQAVGGVPQIPPGRPQGAVPTLKMPTARGWAAGHVPTTAPGLAVNAFAAGLHHPRWIHVLPNGDVTVAEALFMPGPDATLHEARLPVELFLDRHEERLRFRHGQRHDIAADLGLHPGRRIDRPDPTGVENGQPVAPIGLVQQVGCQQQRQFGPGGACPRHQGPEFPARPGDQPPRRPPPGGTRPAARRSGATPASDRRCVVRGRASR